MARRYDIKCNAGHYTETVMTWDDFRSDGHACVVCGEEARVVICKPPFFDIDTVDRYDMTVMLGPEGKYATNRQKLKQMMDAKGLRHQDPETTRQWNEELKQT